MSDTEKLLETLTPSTLLTLSLIANIAWREDFNMKELADKANAELQKRNNEKTN